MRSLIAIAAVALLLACRQAPPEVEIDSWLDAKASSSEKFSLAEIQPGEWDKVVIIGPYADGEAIGESASVDLPEDLAEELRMSDGHCIVAFAQAREVVSWAKVSRGVADFASLAGTHLSREQASFRIVRRPNDGWRVVVVALEGT